MGGSWVSGLPITAVLCLFTGADPGVGDGAGAHPWGRVSPCKIYFSIAFKHQSITGRRPLGEILYPHLIHMEYVLFFPQVSWVRKRDLHILTVGTFTYTNDQRFQALHVPGTQDWTLKLLSPTQADSGVYECHVSTNPKMSREFQLDVTGEWRHGTEMTRARNGHDMEMTRT